MQFRSFGMDFLASLLPMSLDTLLVLFLVSIAFTFVDVAGQNQCVKNHFIFIALLFHVLSTFIHLPLAYMYVGANWEKKCCLQPTDSTQHP